MIDPPRPEVVEAVRTCQAAGIRVKMITGDHAGTATAIAQQIGLDGANDADGVGIALNGEAIAKLSDVDLIEAAEQVAVFARVSPEQKLRLVEALQARNHVVAMTGDGVNDAPALRQANIGVAMGISGTEVSKEASDMVLTDDSFSSIEAAVEEGRAVFDNLVQVHHLDAAHECWRGAGDPGRGLRRPHPANPAAADSMDQSDHDGDVGAHAGIRTEGTRDHDPSSPRSG